jgi:hypothetical protein
MPSSDRQRVILGLLAVWFLGSVAPPAHTAPTAEATDPARFSYRALALSGGVDFELDRHSPTFEFHTGLSPFAAFRLPDTQDAYRVEVISFLEHPEDPAAARVFYPMVALLTGDFLVSRTSDVDALHFDLPILEQTTRPAYRVTIAIDPHQADERYLIVYTQHGFLEPPAPVILSTDEPTAGMHGGLLGASDLGKLRIELRPLGSMDALLSRPPR